MPWLLSGWWESDEYKGRHRLHEASLSMAYLSEFYGVPRKREPTYYSEPLARAKEPVAP